MGVEDKASRQMQVRSCLGSALVILKATGPGSGPCRPSSDPLLYPQESPEDINPPGSPMHMGTCTEP